LRTIDGMKTITKIATQKRAGRYSIELDNQFAFGVAESVLIKYGLAKGRTLDEDLITQIKYDDAIAKALTIALNYLGHALRTTKQIKQKMRDKAVDEDIQAQVIAQLTQLGYVDDQNYANHYVATKKLITPKGPHVIRLALQQAGVAENMIEQALATYTFDEQCRIATKIAEKLAQGYQRESTRLRQQKMVQGLVNKGFSFETAQLVVDSMNIDNNAEDEQNNAKRQAEKLWHRYRHDESQQRFYKVKRQLYAKGFTSELIDAALLSLEQEEV